MKKHPEPIEWIRRVLELASVKWPPRNEALKLASRPSQLPDKRTKWERQCNHCKQWFKSSQIQLDHIIPKGRYGTDVFFIWLERLLCKTSGFQVLCIECHKKKTAQEQSDGSYK